MFESIPPIHRYVPLLLSQTFSRQILERVPEPTVVMDQAENVQQYDQAMTTRLALLYAMTLEIIYRTRKEPYGGYAIDLACGPGHLSLCLAKYLKLEKVTGIDLSEPMVEMALRNALEQGVSSATFQRGDVTRLRDIDDESCDLCTFTDAAHHLPDLETVGHVIAEMDRITRPDGLLFVMDLVRLKTRRITEKYVRLVGRDYTDRGLNAFYSDFNNSMYAAWTVEEFKSVLPRSSRNWFAYCGAGLPTVQSYVGIPKGERRPVRRRGFPWDASESDSPVPTLMRYEWFLLRQSLSRTEVHL